MSLYNRIIDLQKLRAAWQKVRKGKPAAGVDNITAEQFDAGLDVRLKKLHKQLADHTYTARPVRIVTIYKEEKARDIALYCMRDKVVQQSVASELTKIYEPGFSAITYAYVSKRSALNAVEDINAQLQSGNYSYILKLDITHFFDEIDWPMLCAKLKQRIAEEDVLQLIQMNCCGDYLKDDTKDLFPKSKGIYQGSGLSPVLSNIYMQDFDRWLQARTPFCVRYADDMLVLGKTRDELTSLLGEISLRLQELHLRLNEDKTCCVSATDGVEFLGYHFDKSGKSVPAKAQQNLHTRLETMWLSNKSLPLEDKLGKVIEITGGWEQYYRDKREMTSILEFASLAFSSGDDPGKQKALADLRPTLANDYQDIMKYLSHFWDACGLPVMELLEYEQYYQVPDGLTSQAEAGHLTDEKNLMKVQPEAKDSYRLQMKPENSSVVQPDLLSKSTEPNKIQGLLDIYRRYIVHETRDLAIELMQQYTDLRRYQAASFWMKQKDILENKEKKLSMQYHHSGEQTQDTGDGKDPVIFNEKTPEKYLETFAGRTDLYCKDVLGGSHGRQSITQTQPLTTSLVREHLRGNTTLGTYIQRPNATVRYIIFDVDISRKVILQLQGQGMLAQKPYAVVSSQPGQQSQDKKDSITEENGGTALSGVFTAYLDKAFQQAVELTNILRQLGLQGYIEFSGNRGYHVWLFLTEWIPVKYANMFCDIVESRIAHNDDITVEYFPNRTKLKPGRFGQSIKMPYGIHPSSGRRSFFIGAEGQPEWDVNTFADSLAKFTGGAIRKVLARNTGLSDNVEPREVDQDISAYEDADDTVKEVLRGCSLMRYLCLKSVKTNYLTHFERLSILYVFGHMGEPGKKFIHEVMSHTLNYSYNVTEKFIRKCPERPISCVKLQDQYKRITAEIGCNCVFKMKKNCYPSPVLHAILMSTDMKSDITIPISRTITEEKKQEVLDDMNIHKKALTLARQILEYKKQKRGLDRNIKDIEKQLSEIFDDAQIEQLETDMGVLARRRQGNNYEFVIEL